LIEEFDLEYGKTVFGKQPNRLSFSIAFQLVGALRMERYQVSAVLYITELGGMFRLLKHLKHGLEYADLIDAVITAILGIKGNDLGKYNSVELFLKEKEKQTTAYAKSGTIIIIGSDIFPWVKNPPIGFLAFPTNAVNNTMSMSYVRRIEEICELKPPWGKIRIFMKSREVMELLKSQDFMIDYLKKAQIKVQFRKNELNGYKRRLDSIKKKAQIEVQFRKNELNGYKRRLDSIENREHDGFNKLRLVSPLLHDYERLKESHKKPISLFLWGWSCVNKSYGYPSAEKDLTLLRIRFEIGKILPLHQLALSNQEYEFKCIELYKEMDILGNRTYQSKILYDLGLFLHGQSGSASIKYFVKCLEVTNSYASTYQVRMRAKSFVSGLKRMNNFEALSKCNEWVFEQYGWNFDISSENWA